MQPMPRRATCTSPSRIEFSASLTACVCSSPITVLRRIDKVACAWPQSGPDNASCSRPVASSTLSLIQMSSGSVRTSLADTRIVPRMLRSTCTHVDVHSSTRLGSSGCVGRHSGSSVQPGTKVLCRRTN